MTRSAINPGSGLDVAGENAGHDANIQQLATSLYGDYVFALELASVLLIVAVTGTVLRDAPLAPLRCAGVERRSKRRVDLVIAVIEPTWYLLLSALLFSIGAFGLLMRRNPLVMVMCIELMLNAANLSSSPCRCSSATSTARRPCSS